MTNDRGILDRIRARGEEVLTQVSAELSSNPRFARAVRGAMRGKEKLEQGMGRALEQINVPTRSELDRALARIDSLEREVAQLKAKAKGGLAARRRTAARKPRKPAAPAR